MLPCGISKLRLFAALAATNTVKMGACMSSNNEELEQKKRSQKIDRDLEEDSKRLRRECKILLLGMSRRMLQFATSDPPGSCISTVGTCGKLT